MYPKEIIAKILSYVSNVMYFIHSNKLINTQKIITLYGPYNTIKDFVYTKLFYHNLTIFLGKKPN